jgi:hypothetical protein
MGSSKNIDYSFYTQSKMNWFTQSQATYKMNMKYGYKAHEPIPTLAGLLAESTLNVYSSVYDERRNKRTFTDPKHCTALRNHVTRTA